MIDMEKTIRMKLTEKEFDALVEAVDQQYKDSDERLRPLWEGLVNKIWKAKTGARYI